MVAVVPASISFATDKATTEWRERVLLYGSWDDNPTGAFKESGTSVNTCTIWSTKSDISWKNKPYQELSLLALLVSRKICNHLT